eukprot:3285926-Rhodomonas_salina.2
MTEPSEWQNSDTFPVNLGYLATHPRYQQRSNHDVMRWKVGWCRRVSVCCMQRVVSCPEQQHPRSCTCTSGCAKGYQSQSWLCVHLELHSGEFAVVSERRDMKAFWSYLDRFGQSDGNAPQASEEDSWGGR